MFKFRGLVLMGVLGLAMQQAFAISYDKPCPFAQDILKFRGNLEISFPSEYQSSTQSLSMGLMKLQENLHDTTFFVISGINIEKNQDLDEVIDASIAQLKSENEYPAKFEIEDNFDAPICSYTLPNHPEVKALIMTVPYEQNLQQQLNMRKIIRHFQK